MMVIMVEMGEEEKAKDAWARRMRMMRRYARG